MGHTKRLPMGEESIRARQQAAAAAFGVRALTLNDVGEMIDDALRVCVETLHVDLAGMLASTADPGVFEFRSGLGWPDGVVGATVPSRPGSAIEFMLASDRPFVYTDLRLEDRFEPPPMLLAQGVISGIGVIVRGRTGVLGVLGVHATTTRAFTIDDANFIQTMANALSEAIERARAVNALELREERFRRLAENAHDIIYRYRLIPTAGFEYVNPAVQRITGYSPEECYEDPGVAFRMIHPDDRAAMLAGPTLDPEVPRLMRYVRKDGGEIWCELRTVPIYDEAGTLIAVEGIARDVTVRKRVEDQLRLAYEREHAAAEQLRSVDTMKDAFLQAVSHELRTPLAAVMGMAATLQQRFDEIPLADRRMLLDRMVANARRLNALLSDLLDLDRLMRRTIEPMRRPTLLRRLAHEVAATADTGGRAIIVTGPDVVANVDGPKITRLIENLVANAARHTPPETSIWIHIEETPDGTEMIVEDDGPGIPDALKATVFDVFQRAPSRHDYAPGTGIGLALVAKFAELHGGRAWAEDRDGGGAAIHVLLPDAEVRPAADAV